MFMKKEIQISGKQSFEREEIMNKLGLDRLPRQIFCDIMRISFENEVKSRPYNSKHRNIDNVSKIDARVWNRCSYAV